MNNKTFFFSIILLFSNSLFGAQSSLTDSVSTLWDVDAFSNKIEQEIEGADRKEFQLKSDLAHDLESKIVTDYKASFGEKNSRIILFEEGLRDFRYDVINSIVSFKRTGDAVTAQRDSYRINSKLHDLMEIITVKKGKVTIGSNERIYFTALLFGQSKEYKALDFFDMYASFYVKCVRDSFRGAGSLRFNERGVAKINVPVSEERIKQIEQKRELEAYLRRTLYSETGMQEEFDTQEISNQEYYDL